MAVGGGGRGGESGALGRAGGRLGMPFPCRYLVRRFSLRNGVRAWAARGTSGVRALRGRVRAALCKPVFCGKRWWASSSAGLSYVAAGRRRQMYTGLLGLGIHRLSGNERKRRALCAEGKGRAGVCRCGCGGRAEEGPPRGTGRLLLSPLP